MEELLTVEEAADRLGTSVRFVRRLVLSGALLTPSWAATCGSRPAT
jgi:hypothetical protein